jgi:transporter family-2 protein
VGVGIALAVGIGLLIGVQVTLLGRASERFDILAFTLMTQVGGFAVGLAIVLARGLLPQVAVAARSWWWVLLGATGITIITGIGVAASRAGIATTLALMVAAQLLLGLWLDAQRGAVLGRAGLGAALLVAGAYLITSR